MFGRWARPSVVNRNLSRPERVLQCRVPGILQCVSVLLAHKALCNALLIMMHPWCWDACVLYPCGKHLVHFWSLRSFRLFFFKNLVLDQDCLKAGESMESVRPLCVCLSGQREHF